jgi:hypothetical protein
MRKNASTIATDIASTDIMRQNASTIATEPVIAPRPVSSMIFCLVAIKLPRMALEQGIFFAMLRNQN